MPPYNATDSVFFGFRVIKRDPLMMLAIGALLGLSTLIATQLTWRQSLAYAQAYEEYLQASETAEAAQAFIQALFAYIGDPAVLLSFLGLLVVWLAAQGAVLRGLVFDRREGWVMGLQLGADELRLFVVGVATGAILLGVAVLGLVAVAVVTAVFSLAGPVLAALMGMVGGAVCVAALLLVSARLAAAPAASVGERRYVVTGSWRITQGRMWSLLGAFLILIFMTIVAQLALYVLSALLAPGAAATMDGLSAIDPDSSGAVFRSPGYVLLSLLRGLLDAGVMAAFAGVGVYAYRFLGGAAGYPNAQPPADAPFGAPA